MLTAYTAAVRAKDVDAFLDLYADDARNFDLWSVWSYDGKDALRAMVEEWFGSLPDDEVVVVKFDDVRAADRHRGGRGERVHHLRGRRPPTEPSCAR